MFKFEKKNRNARLQYDLNYPYIVYNYCKKALYEKRHIVTEFNDVVDWLTTYLNEFKHNHIIYCGWNWHIASKKCTHDNNINSGHPIYIIIEKINEDIFAYTEKREIEKCKIVLHINEKNIYDEDLASKLHHEFTHIRTCYSRFFYDPLITSNNKYDVENILYFIDIKSKTYSLYEFEGAVSYWLFNTSYIGRAQNMLYFLSKTEQQARLNQVYKFIIEKYNKNNVPNRAYLLKETSSISLLQDFLDQYDYIDECMLDDRLYKNNICIAYYLNEFGYMSNSLLTKENMLKYFNIIDGKNQTIETDMIVAVIKAKTIIDKSLATYQTDILNIIDDAIYDIQNNVIK